MAECLYRSDDGALSAGFLDHARVAQPIDLMVSGAQRPLTGGEKAVVRIQPCRR
jgi:hypothetical protein